MGLPTPTLPIWTSRSPRSFRVSASRPLGLLALITRKKPLKNYWLPCSRQHPSKREHMHSTASIDFCFLNLKRAIEVCQWTLSCAGPGTVTRSILTQFRHVARAGHQGESHSLVLSVRPLVLHAPHSVPFLARASPSPCALAEVNPIYEFTCTAT